MGGEIGVASAEGSGSTFWFTFCVDPAAALTVSETPAPADVPMPTSPADTAKVALNILVVHDNLINRQVATRMLEHEGHRVDVAENGEEALAAVSRVRYAAVLMDCQMPIMDGYQTTRAIRNLPTPHRDTPIIAMTAGASISERDRSFAAGMDKYISKPMRRRDLLAVVTRSTSEEGLAGRGPGHSNEPVSDLLRTDSAAALNPSTLDELKDLDAQGGSISQLVQPFLNEVSTGLEELRGGVEQANVPLVASICHRLQGASTAFGASRMARLFAELEGAVSTGAVEGQTDILRRLEVELPRVASALACAFSIAQD